MRLVLSIVIEATQLVFIVWFYTAVLDEAGGYHCGFYLWEETTKFQAGVVLYLS